MPVKCAMCPKKNATLDDSNAVKCSKCGLLYHPSCAKRAKINADGWVSFCCYSTAADEVNEVNDLDENSRVLFKLIEAKFNGLEVKFNGLDSKIDNTLITVKEKLCELDDRVLKLEDNNVYLLENVISEINKRNKDKRQTRIFKDLGENWWDPHGNFRGLHQVHELVFLHIGYTLQKHGRVKEEDGKLCVPNECHLLDVGCGGGILTEPLSEIGFDVVGIDINQKLIEVATEHARLSSSPKRLSYAWETIETHAQNYPEKYDVVIITFVLPHVKNHEIFLEKAIETLKPGGLLYLTSVAKTFTSWIRVNIFGAYVYRYLPKNFLNWNNFISAKEVVEILCKNNCAVFEIKGLYYDFFKSNFNWWNNVDGGAYSMIAVKNY
ncbi:hypothetical protein FQA39_LY00061 [Lamprigera yunnana]|nr:hypothetical protein FQA39_LY00061 [Lamprigera yunnana]